MTDATLPEAVVRAATDELQSHTARFSTVYDGQGGVTWEDDGGILCSCGTHFPRRHALAARPWADFYTHVAAATVAAARRAELEDGPYDPGVNQVPSGVDLHSFAYCDSCFGGGHTTCHGALDRPEHLREWCECPTPACVIRRLPYVWMREAVRRVGRR